jgi:hypothetical protein
MDQAKGIARHLIFHLFSIIYECHNEMMQCGELHGLHVFRGDFQDISLKSPNFMIKVIVEPVDSDILNEAGSYRTTVVQ